MATWSCLCTCHGWKMHEKTDWLGLPPAGFKGRSSGSVLASDFNEVSKNYIFNLFSF